jgi:hypothetical protein
LQLPAATAGRAERIARPARDFVRHRPVAFEPAAAHALSICILIGQGVIVNLLVPEGREKNVELTW